MIVLRDKEAYRKLYDLNRDENSVFTSPYWLDVIVPDWQCIVVSDEKEVVAGFAYSAKKKYGLTAITMPYQTPYTHIIFSSDHSINRKKVSKLIIENIPSVILISLSIDYRQNPLPWKWCGYSLGIDNTHIIDETDYKIMTAARHVIVHASKSLSVKEIFNIDEFYKCLSYTFKRQNLDDSFSKEVLEKILSQNKLNGKMLGAIDNEGTIHACVLIVEDSGKCYNLLSGRIDNATRGAVAILHDYLIKETIAKGKVYDFEGGNKESIGQFFQSFGAKQANNTRVVKTKNKLINLLINLFNKYN